MNNTKRRYAGILLIIISLLLLFAFVTVHSKNSTYFGNTVTYYNSAKAISEDLPDTPSIYAPRFREVLKNYTAGYLIPAFLLLLPAVFSLAAGLRFTEVLKKPPLDFLKEKAGEKTFLWLASLFVIAVCIYIFYGVMGQTNIFIDEFSYLFQAKIMSEGKLYAQSPPLPEYFSCAHIINDGKWYSKFTPGLPALLVPGVILEIPVIIPILAAAGSVFLLYLITKRLFGSKSAFISVILAIVSPYFLLTGVTIFPHTPQGFFILLFLWLLLQSDQSGKFHIPLCAGLSAGMAILIRPADAIMAIAGFIPFIIFMAAKSENRKNWIKKASLITAGLSAGVALLLLSNWIQNGSPMLMGFEKYWSVEKWGFGSMEHTPLKGLWNLFYSSARMAFWVVPLTSIGIIAALFIKRKEVPLLLIPPAFILLFYIGYYSLGNQEFGARYYYLSYILLLPICAAGIANIPAIIGKNEFISGQEFSLSFALMTAIAVIAGVFPGILPSLGKQCAGYGQIMKWIKTPPVPQAKMLTFIRNSPSLMVYYYTRNRPDYNNDGNLLAVWLAPDKNLELIKAFPDRMPMLITYDEGAGYRIQPYPADPKQLSIPANWLFAGLNYKLSVFDNNKTESSFRKAVELSPSDIGIRMNLAIFLMEMKKYNDALAELEIISKGQPGLAAVIYCEGRCLGELGKIKEAREKLDQVIRSFPQTPEAERAGIWLRYYSK